MQTKKTESTPDGNMKLSACGVFSVFYYMSFPYLWIINKIRAVNAAVESRFIVYDQNG